MAGTNRRTLFATILGNSLAVSKEKHTPSVKIRVATSFDLSDPSTPVKLNLVGDLWLTDESIARSIASLHDIGWKGRLLSDLNDPVLSGNKCIVVVEDEIYEGKTRVKICFFNSPGGAHRLNDEDLENLILNLQPKLDDILGKRSFSQEPAPYSEANPNETSAACDTPFESLPF